MKRIFTGKVISDAMDKTAVVQVDRMVSHKMYDKKYRVSKHFSIHDENNEAKVGNVVTFSEVMPISKSKRWSLVSIVSKEEL